MTTTTPTALRPRGRPATTCVLGLVLVLALQGCSRQEDLPFLERLARDPTPVFRGSEASEETMDMVRQVLKEYREEIDGQVENSAQLGQLYKSVALNYLEIGLLQQTIDRSLRGEASAESRQVPDGAAPGPYQMAVALRFLDSRIYADALFHLEKAIAVFPDNEVLFYNAGVAAAHMGKALVTPEQSEARLDWYQRSEAYYRRATELQPRYVNALYGLAVLLFYELDRAADAEELLLRVLEVQSRDINAMFLLASVYYQMGRLRDAVALYETIEEATRDGEIIAAARANKERVGGEIGDVR